MFASAVPWLSVWPWISTSVPLATTRSLRSCFNAAAAAGVKSALPVANWMSHVRRLTTLVTFCVAANFGRSGAVVAGPCAMTSLMYETSSISVDGVVRRHEVRVLRLHDVAEDGVRRGERVRGARREAEELLVVG